MNVSGSGNDYIDNNLAPDDRLPTRSCVYVHKSTEDLLDRVRQLEQGGSRAAMQELERLKQELNDYIDSNDSKVGSFRTEVSCSRQMYMKEQANFMEARMLIERGIENLAKKHTELKTAFSVAESAAVDAKAYVQLFDADTWPKFKEEVGNKMNASRFTRGEYFTMVGLALTVVLSLSGLLSWVIRQNNVWLLGQVDSKIVRIEARMEASQDAITHIIETMVEQKKRGGK